MRYRSRANALDTTRTFSGRLASRSWRSFLPGLQQARCAAVVDGSNMG
jgi:hypothetical protein